MKTKLFLILVAVTVAVGCQQKRQATADHGLPDRDPALAYRLVQGGAPLLDVRTPQEYQARHVDGSHLIPLQELPSRLKEVQDLVGGDKNRPIVVHCQSGRRAAQAKDILLQNGFPNVTNLGGIDDWPKKD